MHSVGALKIAGVWGAMAPLQQRRPQWGLLAVVGCFCYCWPISPVAAGAANWSWLGAAGGWGNMADLAERVDDLICSFDSSADATMDTLSMLVFGWMLLGLVILCQHRGAAPTGANSKEQLQQSPLAAGLHVIGEGAVLFGAGSNATGVAAAVARSRSANASRASAGATTPGSARSSRSLQVASATGPDPDAVRWTNEMLYWLHADLIVLDELLAVWVDSLNDFVATSVAEHGIGVEFVRVLPETHPPSLSNIFCECDSKDDVTITCDCEATPALQLKAFRQHGDKIEASHYRVNVNRFRARLNVVCITEKLLVDLKCDGWPDVKVSMAPVGMIKKDMDEAHVQEILNEIVVGAIRGTNLHLNLSGYSNCPRLWRESVANQTGYSLPIHYDSMAGSNPSIGHHQQQHHRGQAHSASASTVHQYAPGERRLLVKVVRAADLAGQTDCREPYCVVEVDEPPQRHQTSVKRETKSPVWDEAFLFDISQNTTEVLLEVYDRFNKSDRFLGLGIVGVEELLANPSQRQIIPLQSRPYEEDEVTGTLTVEFLFIEGAEVPQIGNKPYKVKETIRPPASPTRTYNPNNNLLSNNSLNYNNDFLSNGGSMVESPYRTGQTNGNKGTLIVHSQQRLSEREILKVTLNESGGWQEIQSEHGDRDARAPMAQDSATNSSNSDSVKGREGHSRRSSISEASAISGTSTKTYVNEASTLVLETMENGIRKHYLVPLSLAQKSRWKKKGTKLHIFNDHTFIAKHMSGGTVCEVCKKTLARRLGKQGYECRDCQMKCHKHCHVKVDSMCSSSTIQNIELSLLPVLSE
ncbi:hypothetical protein QAD02_017100 [Eretmocerus hayati]|uniref:Uncharacterized protein n=1 Tax=Eretmocerus hayati TaxID=131215 RepID=A0ACC2PDZ6_9HYME|nr:hypothetical protein QAD02_017100 [Eretmocerus hayati]